MEKKKNKQKVFVASDHGGFNLKNSLIGELSDIYEVVDLGPYKYIATDDYPDYAFLLAENVVNKKGSLGILICRSGNGMVIAANKVDGAYAALCFSPDHAKKAREDDNANILCLDADYGDGLKSIDIAKAFLFNDFAGLNTRHGRRFKKIQQYEIQREQFLLNSNPRVAIRALIVKNDQVLLIINKKDNSLYLPGGKVEIYQSIKDTIQRELSEELSMEVNVEVHQLLAVKENLSPHRGKHKFDIIYICKIDKGEEIEGVSDPNHFGEDFFTWRNIDDISAKNDKGHIRQLISEARQKGFI